MKDGEFRFAFFALAFRCRNVYAWLDFSAEQ